MSTQAICDFYARIAGSDELQLQVSKLSAEGFPEALASLGAEHGHGFTAEEVRAVLEQGASDALDDAQLEQAVGGMSFNLSGGSMEFMRLQDGLKLQGFSVGMLSMPGRA